MDESLVEPAPRNADQVASSGSSPEGTSQGPPESVDSHPRRARVFIRFLDALTWTASQRRGQVVALSLVLGLLLWRAIFNSVYISDPQPIRPARIDELADRIDPNVAPWTELVALPQLGETRARAIVEYREDWVARHPGQLAYRTLIDLAAVKGVGASTLENMAPYLTLPDDPKPVLKLATKPSSSRPSRQKAK